jgi:hypothetical protein
MTSTPESRDDINELSHMQAAKIVRVGGSSDAGGSLDEVAGAPS